MNESDASAPGKHTVSSYLGVDWVQLTKEKLITPHLEVETRTYVVLGNKPGG